MMFDAGNQLLLGMECRPCQPSKRMLAQLKQSGKTKEEMLGICVVLSAGSHSLKGGGRGGPAPQKNSNKSGYTMGGTQDQSLGKLSPRQVLTEQQHTEYEKLAQQGALY